MEKQLNFTDMEYGNRRRVTKREAFLNKMDQKGKVLFQIFFISQLANWKMFLL